MQTSTHSKFTHWFIVYNMILITVGSIVLVYLAFFDGGKPIVIYDQPLMTVEDHYDKNGDFIPKDTFYTGDRLAYLLNFCKTRNVPAEMYGSYIDTVKIDMPVVKIKSGVGCDTRISSQYLVPKILPTGMYHFEVELIYQVNPIREVRVKYRTQDFKIINDSIVIKN